MTTNTAAEPIGTSNCPVYFGLRAPVVLTVAGFVVLGRALAAAAGFVSLGGVVTVYQATVGVAFDERDRTIGGVAAARAIQAFGIGVAFGCSALPELPEEAIAIELHSAATDTDTQDLLPKRIERGKDPTTGTYETYSGLQSATVTRTDGLLEVEITGPTGTNSPGLMPLSTDPNNHTYGVAERDALERTVEFFHRTRWRGYAGRSRHLRTRRRSATAIALASRTHTGDFVLIPPRSRGGGGQFYFVAS
jgi:hypothetical protein